MKCELVWLNNSTKKGAFITHKNLQGSVRGPRHKPRLSMLRKERCWRKLGSITYSACYAVPVLHEHSLIILHNTLVRKGIGFMQWNECSPWVKHCRFLFIFHPILQVSPNEYCSLMMGELGLKARQEFSPQNLHLVVEILLQRNKECTCDRGLWDIKDVFVPVRFWMQKNWCFFSEPYCCRAVYSCSQCYKLSRWRQWKKIVRVRQGQKLDNYLANESIIEYQDHSVKVFTLENSPNSSFYFSW